jgi:hypothetical protein
MKITGRYYIDVFDNILNVQHIQNNYIKCYANGKRLTF